MAHSPRPTLPPLHSLQLPRPRLHDLYDLDERISRLDLTDCHQRQQSPTPSPKLSSPPVPCLRSRTNLPAMTPFPVRKVRLVPTSLENADAVVLVQPPNTPNAPPPQPLLLVGPALARLRHPQRKLAKGARIHPYRIARPADRRSPARPAYPNA